MSVYILCTYMLNVKYARRALRRPSLWLDIRSITIPFQSLCSLCYLYTNTYSYSICIPWCNILITPSNVLPGMTWINHHFQCSRAALYYKPNVTYRAHSKLQLYICNRFQYNVRNPNIVHQLRILLFKSTFRSIIVKCVIIFLFFKWNTIS